MVNVCSVIRDPFLNTSSQSPTDQPTHLFCRFFFTVNCYTTNFCLFALLICGLRCLLVSKITSHITLNPISPLGNHGRFALTFQRLLASELLQRTSECTVALCRLNLTEHCFSTDFNNAAYYTRNMK